MGFDIITPEEAERIKSERKPERSENPPPGDAEEQVVEFLQMVNKAITEHYSGAPLMVSTSSIHTSALKMAEEALARAGWGTKRVKEENDWLLKIWRNEKHVPGSDEGYR